MIFERRFIYFPSRYPNGEWPRAAAPDRSIQPFPHVEDVWFKADDGVALHGWYCTPCRAVDGVDQPIPTEGVLLYLHGNAGNISHRYDQLHLLMFLGVSVFIIDYRGYGRSEGKPSEKGLYLDARAAWSCLTESRRVDPGNIVVLGKSLGGAVAIDLASDGGAAPAGLIVQSSFTSVADMARLVMPIIPRSWIRTKMNSIAKIDRVDCPKLFVHSRADEIVPYELGRQLYEAASSPKHFYTVEGAGHNDTTSAGGKAYMRQLQDFIADALTASRAGR